MFLLRIAFWLGLLGAVLWLWPASRLGLFLVFQGGGRDSQLALFGLVICGVALFLSVLGAFLTRAYDRLAGIVLLIGAVVGAFALFAVTLPLGSIADLAAGALALVASFQRPDADDEETHRAG